MAKAMKPDRGYEMGTKELDRNQAGLQNGRRLPAALASAETASSAVELDDGRLCLRSENQGRQHLRSATLPSSRRCKMDMNSAVKYLVGTCPTTARRRPASLGADGLCFIRLRIADVHLSPPSRSRHSTAAATSFATSNRRCRPDLPSYHRRCLVPPSDCRSQSSPSPPTTVIGAEDQQIAIGAEEGGRVGVIGDLRLMAATG
ncbi:thyroid hormone receptor beta [Striga asiatica]|uniref:Thyroid hormone receptor beta n=1 Tax=Striga asiatica TaxID=4170 RepID=A0A5A7QE29_STRAF|nr:thyroid hormone receptor beta [Striga asiatica]